MSFGYVCTNFNNSQFTAAAVETLEKSAVPPSRIVVVDNASRADDVAALHAIAERFPKVELILNSENVGYFPGLNVGIRHLGKTGARPDAVVIGNNDLEFPADFGTTLERLLPEWVDYPVVSPSIVTLDGVPQNPHVISGISRFREFVYDVHYASYYFAVAVRSLARWTHGVSDRKDELQHDQAQLIYQGYGACYILTQAFFQEFKELWAPSFMTYEEFFLSRQLSEKGKRVFYDPRIGVRHRCNGAVENLPSRVMWKLARDSHRIYRRYVKPWRKQGI